MSCFIKKGPGTSEMRNNFFRLVDELIKRGIYVFEKVYPLMRPAAHNRIALAVVTAGLCVFWGPYWEPYLRAAVQEYLHTPIDPPTDPGYGLALAAIGMLYHLLAVRADNLRKEIQEKRVREHDAPIVKKFQEHFSENSAREMFTSLKNDHSYYFSQSRELGNGYTHLLSVDSHFLDESMKGAAERLSLSLAELEDFISCQFFVYPPNQIRGDTRYCLQPTCSLDRAFPPPSNEQSRQYNELSRRLTELVDNAAKAYESFVHLAHERVL